MPLSNSIDGASGMKDICDKWFKHYQKLMNSVPKGQAYNKVEQVLRSTAFDSKMIVDCNEVKYANKDLSSNSSFFSIKKFRKADQYFLYTESFNVPRKIFPE